MKITSSHDSVERLKKLTFNNMKNIKDGEPLNILPSIDRSLFLSTALDKKDFKDLDFGSVTLSGLTADFVIGTAERSHAAINKIDKKRLEEINLSMEKARDKSYENKLFINTLNSFLGDSSSKTLTFDPTERIEKLKTNLKILKDVSDYCDNNGGKKVEEAKVFLKESLAKVGEEINLLIDSMRVDAKRMPFGFDLKHRNNGMITLGNSLEGEALKIDNSTFKDNGMIELGNSIKETPLKIKNSTFSDSFGDV